MHLHYVPLRDARDPAICFPLASSLRIFLTESHSERTFVLSRPGSCFSVLGSDIRIVVSEKIKNGSQVMFPSTVERVSVNTAQEVMKRFRRRMEESVAFHADAGREPSNRRLVELDYEWDNRAVAGSNAATLALVGVTLGATVDRRWYILPGIVAGFLLQHALQGWCHTDPAITSIGHPNRPGDQRGEECTQVTAR